MIKTVLELDLVGYSTIAATLESGLDVQVSAQLNQQIQDFVDVGLKAAGVNRPDTVMATTGDGAILVFDKPSLAHTFAAAVQKGAREHNSTKPVGIGKRVFRIGIATGDLVMQPKPTGGHDIAGLTIARAVRLEAKANPGEVLCDPDTFAGLTAAQKKRYSSPETIAGKRNETFVVRRCILNPDGVTDAEFFTGPPAGAALESLQVTKSSVTANSRAGRKEIVKLSERLKPNQLPRLVFLLCVPIQRRPSSALDLAGQVSHLLQWAEEDPADLENLLLELRDLVGSAGGGHPH